MVVPYFRVFPVLDLQFIVDRCAIYSQTTELKTGLILGAYTLEDVFSGARLTTHTNSHAKHRARQMTIQCKTRAKQVQGMASYETLASLTLNETLASLR